MPERGNRGEEIDRETINFPTPMDRNLNDKDTLSTWYLEIKQEPSESHHFRLSALGVQKLSVHRNVQILYKESVIRMIGHFSTAIMECSGPESKVQKLSPILNSISSQNINLSRDEIFSDL